VDRWLATLDDCPEALGSVEAWARCAGLSAGRLRRLVADGLATSPGRLLAERRRSLAEHLVAVSDLDRSGAATVAGASPTREARPARTGTAVSLSLWLPAEPPFPAGALRAFLARRLLPGVETAAGADYGRRWDGPGGTGTVALRIVEGGVRVRAAGPAPVPLAELLARTTALLDLDAPVREADACLAGDPLLAAAVARTPGLRLPGAWDPFELLVRAILGQQVSVEAARTQAVRLVEGAAPAPGRFPDAWTLARVDLGFLRMPAARRETLRTVARAVVEGRLDPSAPAAELRPELLALRGIGPWTADYVCLRAARDRDAFPAGDLVLRRALAEGGRLPELPAMERRAERWRPFRAHAVPHLWARAGGGG
jgi:AraC family transcriptional regulator of adaptative response / DNA-3-methyladenine glycosylase II